MILQLGKIASETPFTVEVKQVNSISKVQLTFLIMGLVETLEVEWDKSVILIMTFRTAKK